MEADTPTIETPTSHLFHRVQDGLAASGGGSLLDFIVQRRAAGVAYRHIAIELTNITGVDITHEAPRRWHIHYLRQTQPAAAVAEAAGSTPNPS